MGCRGKPLSEAVSSHGAEVVLMSDVVYYEEVSDRHLSLWLEESDMHLS